MLDLRSQQWSAIRASAGGDGMLTATLLRQMTDGEESACAEMREQICHQHTVGEVAYVAAPHLVGIARTATSQHIRAVALSAIGNIVASLACHPESAATLQDVWKAEFERACGEARELVAEILREPLTDRDDSAMLVGTLAALHGHPVLYMLVEPGPDIYCPECGQWIKY